MTALTTVMTTMDGILTTEIDDDTVTLALKRDDGGEHVIQIPAFKFAWIVKAFTAAQSA